MSSRVLVTGSRDWVDRLAIERVMDRFDLLLPRPITLVSGHCPTGADFIAEQHARALGWDIELYPADWETHGKRAGYLRNKEMVDAGADIVIAFILNASRGGLMTVKLAKEAGLPVRMLEVTG